MCQVETVLAQIMSLKQHEVETVLQQLNDTVCCVIQMKTKILSLAQTTEASTFVLCAKNRKAGFGKATPLSN